ncbi:asparaginase [Hoeflea sp. WL0058]|uniref:Asparaginase n=1 Tax=Flavimaribacter sediminis TaxID=2865987 RepID=A0AAE3D371_9HYPH|nr:asparaginase [Flavimaribacter sediminis]MBW8639338.1 asparaginase [Flavimaribacter sediminis]
MANPVLVEVTRGGRVESRHRGAAVAVDAAGQIIFSKGDTSAPIFPRSAVKAMQALPLVESGAADAYGFGDREIALACSSHSGQPEHVALAAAMLKAAGRDADALECGCHWPFNMKVSTRMAASGGKLTTLHNNCSGKHAGFVCVACHLGHSPAGYINYDHPVQGLVRDALGDLTGAHYGVDTCGTDGCSIPTYAVPLPAVAHGFAKMTTGEGLAPARAKAARRIIEACMAEPFYVAGSKRACTRLMELAPGKVFAKTGAEGVFCAALPEQGVGVAVKCDDGATRAAEAMVAAVLALLVEDEALRDGLRAIAGHSISNWNGIETGHLRVTEALL